MKLSFPSPEFDESVAAACHGSASEVELRALNELLRGDARARDEYLLRVELHARLASEPDLFASTAHLGEAARACVVRLEDSPAGPAPRAGAIWRRSRGKILALAAGLALLAAGIWGLWFRTASPRDGSSATAVAMLTRVVDARWGAAAPAPRTGSALRPGRLQLEAGLAQVLFYSGARMVVEGPADLRLLSPSEASCSRGRLLLEVPPAATGFRLRTESFDVVDLGTAFGVDANRDRNEVHVFKGRVELQGSAGDREALTAGQAAVAAGNAPLRRVAATAAGFAPLFEFQQRSLASEAYRYEQWQFASAQLNQDPSLILRLDFETPGSTDWTLRNTAEQGASAGEATLVGCQRGEGRWREKAALEFQSLNDRVRLAVPGEYDALTLSAWVRISGLDRQFNSLFMCDAFDAGTIHWLIRDDGVLGLTVFGAEPGEFQILASPRALGLDEYGMWAQLAVVLDGRSRQVTHFVNGAPVSRDTLRLGPPFRIGPAEVGNWNARGGPSSAPSLIRNFSGAFDELLLFNRALTDAEVRELYLKGRPDA